jgi:hypothetical protein
MTLVTVDITNNFLEKICCKCRSGIKDFKITQQLDGPVGQAVAANRNSYSAIIFALEEILKTTQLAEVKVKGHGLLHQLKTFEFIFYLEMMLPILQLILKVSKSLQSLELNLLSATAGVKSLHSALTAMKNDEYFQELFKTISEICKKT